MLGIRIQLMGFLNWLITGEQSATLKWLRTFRVALWNPGAPGANRPRLPCGYGARLRPPSWTSLAWKSEVFEAVAADVWLWVSGHHPTCRHPAPGALPSLGGRGWWNMPILEFTLSPLGLWKKRLIQDIQSGAWEPIGADWDKLCSNLDPYCSVDLWKEQPGHSALYS